MDVLDADVLRAWAGGARTALALARPAVDAVNVFPVADADTGTNALLTVTGGTDAVAALPAGTDAPAVARAFAQGALLAARGNSGVILSQYLAGFADGLADGVPQDGAAAVVRALASAARAARAAVAEPSEGTVLTLADVVAARAASLGPGLAPGALLGSVLDDALGALDPISAEHPVLAREHVPDAGACALLVVLDALHRAVTGVPEPTTPAPWLPPVAHHAHGGHEGSGAFEVMLVVRSAAGEDLTGALQTRLSAVGDSVAVVGGDGVWHVHVHTDHPDAAVDAAALGAREQVVVRLVDAPHGQSVDAGDVQPRDADPAARWGLVACTAAPGLAAWYAAAGAVVLVVPPDAPVTATHVARAVADTGAADVALLPGGLVPAEALGERPGPVVEVLDADDELRVVVATLAFASSASASASASGTAAAVHDAVRALGRLRVVRVDDATALPAALDDVLTGAHGESLTVLHRDPLDDATAGRLEAGAAASGLETVLVGPTGDGAAFWLGVD
ncbi:DAK2 domain-containing protein [Cellulomonas fimi]|uniref:DAK2 domain-containing protein n=1 Tax=Cellulomonas fimi TaxID=1708 RepID=UPI002358DA70|nr:DAK2 domain-containing protein [Cellulomonas fimi]